VGTQGPRCVHMVPQTEVYKFSELTALQQL